MQLLNPNCSELVTHLGFKTREEIIGALKEMNALEGFTLAMRVDTKKEYVKKSKISDNKYKSPNVMIFPILDEFMDANIEIVEGEHGSRNIRVNSDSLLFDWAYKMDKEKCNEIKDEWKEKIKDDRSWDLVQVRLLKGTYTEVTEVEESHSYINFGFGDGYCEDDSMTAKCTQHCCENEFPALFEVCKLFDTSYHAHDGGSTGSFEEWMEKNKKEGVSESD